MPPDQNPEIPDQIALPYLMLLSSGISLLSFAFWMWMCIDCYRRRGGLDSWHYFFFIFPPSTLLYCIVHKGDMFFGSRSGTDKGLFGWGLRSRIKRAENQLRISGTAAARFELAELYFENAQYDPCEKLFDEILKTDEKNWDAWYYVGLCRLHRKDAAGALECLQKVMEGSKKLRFGVAWMRYTDCLNELGRKEEALEERRKLARAFPRPLMEFAYAQALVDSGDQFKAREVLDEMIATSSQAPREDRQWLRRGKSLLRTLE